MSCNHCLCECERPGPLRTGEPGILATMESGRVSPHAVVERCDQCRRYPTDAAALARLSELGLTNAAAASRPTFIVHCDVIARVTFTGVVADDAQSAAQQVRDRFDWDAHRDQAEYADEIVDLLVEVNGDAEFRQSRRFSGDLVKLDVPPTGAGAPFRLAPRLRAWLRDLQLLLSRPVVFWRHRLEPHDP